MKIKALILITAASLIVLFIMYSSTFQKQNEMNVLLLPSLPRPIAKEYALITSAGQSTEAYIINDIANELLIHNYFMPQAKEFDLDGISTVVFAIGYSPLGEKLNSMSIEAEKNRLISLIKKAKEKKLVLISIYIGGKERRDKDTEELLKLVCPQTNYIIGTKEANYDGFLSELARDGRIPLTLIKEISDIAEPFASAFR